MSRYQAYPEYKQSVVEWLGEIPQHWEYVRLKNVANLVGAKIEPGSALKYVGLENIESGSGKYVEKDEVIPEGQANSFAQGNVLFGKLRPYLAKSWLAEFSGICSSEFLVFESKKVSSRFLNYFTLTPEFIKQVDSSTYGSKMPRASWDFIGLLEVPVPDNESEKIANFLDHETAKIDTLIEQQQQLIQLLKEKRQAVISHAVTKGLNPDVPMKDSGVEWLGEVPQHWVTCSLKHYANVIDCKHITAEFLDDGFPLASIGEVKEWFVNLASAKFTSEKFYQDLIGGGRKPIAGDIIYSRNATVGEAALVSPHMQDFAMGQDVCLIRLERNLSPEYIMHVLKSPVIYRQLELAMVGSTFKRINVDDIRNFNLAVPLIDEQIEIVEQLEMLLTKYDKIIYGAQESIGLMQERRTALISAAVTGKIDVRAWQAPTIIANETNPQEACA